MNLTRFVFYYFFISIFQISICYSSDNCDSKKTCSQCVRMKDCTWCYSMTDSMEGNKCVATSDVPVKCSEKEQVKPETAKMIVQNNAAQIAPQIINLSMRPGDSFKIIFTYTETKNYPVDLYFLMDLSASMVIHRNKLSTLGIKISDKMKELTQETRLGFGSFVDKPARPFVNTYPPKFKNPCTKFDCNSPYSFKNHLSLTVNAELFTQVVNRTKESANLDSPEGGLDALMQVLTCAESIGWREKARRLIIFSTDDFYHIAGDGKLGGILEPNDGRCHMKNNTYTYALQQDYPSIGQIHAKSLETNMIIIFAVTQSIYNTYSKLKEVIHQAQIVVLSEDSENIVELLDNIYKNITDKVTFSHTFDDNFKISMESSDCQQDGQQSDFACGNIKVNQPIAISVDINLVSCPSNGEFHKKFYIKPSGLNENITFDVTMICDCPCEHNGDGFEKKSMVCNEAGNLQCGICHCYKGKQGPRCDCEGDKRDLTKGCIDETSGLKCSNQGTCICGSCICTVRSDTDEIISGEYCECDNYSCKRHNDQLCSGNGKCVCKKCECSEGWSGIGCDCSTEKNECFNPKTNEICSNKGNCECNKCKCKQDEHKYYGQYCENCDTCVKECNELLPIIECLAFGIDDKKHQCQNDNVLMNVTIVNEIVNYNCTLFDNENCTSTVLVLSNSHILVEEKKCITGASAAVILPIIISTIIVAGLILLLIWKGLTYYYDRREYQKFLLENKNSKWQNGENPLFVKATSTFSNPLFGTE